MKMAIVLGAATPPGRLAQAASRIAQLAREGGANVEPSLVDLSALKVEICDGRRLEAYGDDTRRAVQAIADASAVVFAAPVYRATYPGVLKNLLDLLPLEALEGKPVGIVAMGASPHHFLGVDNQLRPVLAWFGALAAPTSVYLTGEDFKEGKLASPQALADLQGLVSTVIRLAERLGGSVWGPKPLAARTRG